MSQTSLKALKKRKESKRLNEESGEKKEYGPGSTLVAIEEKLYNPSPLGGTENRNRAPSPGQEVHFILLHIAYAHSPLPPVNCWTKNIPRPSPLIPIADLGRGRIVPFDPPPVNWTATFVGVPSCFVGLRRPPVTCRARAASVPRDSPVNWRAMVVTPVCCRSICPELGGSGSLEGDEWLGETWEDRSSWGRSN